MRETKPDALLAFRETPFFMNRIAELAGEDAVGLLFAIQQELLSDPKRGDLIEGIGGARKARIADPHSAEGKRGGFRYIYYYFEHRSRIYLLHIYGKREQATLTADDKKKIKAVIGRLKREES
ncbi:MAG TPA: type II toxin-antitoxin system RelE/ParE family toxin [Blastocatellia bacterium]|nr:type II toxin-antitoxin system RelE/ParE family toxin [Blastocatellia bacterium]